MNRKIKPSFFLLAVLLVFIVVLWLVDSGRAATMTKGPKPIVFTNASEVTGNFVRPPLCVGSGERVEYLYEVKNVGLNTVLAEVHLDFWVGGLYGFTIADAKPSLRGSLPSKLYWPVTLLPGKSAKLRLTVVVPNWTGGFSFGFGYNLIVPGMAGWQFASTYAESCYGADDGGK